MTGAGDISPNPGAYIPVLGRTRDLVYQLAMAVLMAAEDEEGGWSEGSGSSEVQIFFGPGGATVESATTGSPEGGSSHHASWTDPYSDNGAGPYSFRCSDAIHTPFFPKLMPFQIPQLPLSLQLWRHLLSELHLYGHTLHRRNRINPPHIPDTLHNWDQHAPAKRHFLPDSHRLLPVTPAHLPAPLTSAPRVSTS
ncbi:hypothetical protein HOY80DRAFT_1133976 [Tuber brumale]|nr:hypothetical protein HOY80DRAFT_1133976 [Tuber brumale]